MKRKNETNETKKKEILFEREQILNALESNQFFQVVFIASYSFVVHIRIIRW